MIKSKYFFCHTLYTILDSGSNDYHIMKRILNIKYKEISRRKHQDFKLYDRIVIRSDILSKREYSVFYILNNY
jgi:hypothetical protein